MDTESQRIDPSAASKLIAKPSAKIDHIVDDLQAMVERVSIAEAMAAEATAKQLQTNQLNIKLVAEVEMLQERVDVLSTQLTYTQSYATDLTTRLNVVGDIVKEAVSEARQFARNQAVQPKGDHLTTADSIALKSVVSRLPQNSLNTEPGGVTPMTRR